MEAIARWSWAKKHSKHMRVGGNWTAASRQKPRVWPEGKGSARPRHWPGNLSQQRAPEKVFRGLVDF